ncbi:MAG: MipA/OmpV family protein [Campylobacterales bacterium]
MKKIIFLTLMPLLLFAENPHEVKNEEKLDLSLGLASFYKESIYKQNSNRVVVFPSVDLDYYGLYIKGTQLGYNFKLSRGLYISPTLTYRFDGYDNDGSYMDGMERRKDSVYGGARVSYTYKGHTVYSSYSQDVAGVNDGGYGTIGYRYFKLFYPFALSPSISYQYNSKNYSNYYYGVKSKEALPQRPEYNPGATSSASASLLGIYHVSKKAYLFGLLSYELQESAIKSSPIVDKRDAYGVGLGFAYKIY